MSEIDQVQFQSRTLQRASTGIVLVALAPIAAVFAAGDEAALTPPDLSAWKCEYCAFEEGWYGDVNVGLGNVSDDSFKFGEYNGLHEAGTYGILDANLYYRGEEAQYLDFSVADAGLDSRSLSIAGGRQGSFDLYLDYNEIPHFISDSASTPYRGNGSDRLRLPSGFQAGSTAGMTKLDSSLQPVDIETSRERLGVGARLTTESPWSYSAEVRRDDKQGTKYGGGAFFFNSVQLVEPVDYVTDEIDAAVSYTRRDWQARLAYYASTFKNANESLTWDNAYTALVAGADQGQLALPPDNEFQQVTLSIAYDISERNHVSASVAIGRMEQDADFVPATTNSMLAVPALPAESADARVDTSNTRIKWISMPTDRLRLSAGYSHDDRDNRTPQLVYDWVTTDSFVATPRSNQPYSITSDLLSLDADYNYAPGVKLGLGFDRKEVDRDLQEVDETREDTLSGRVRFRNMSTFTAEFKLALSERDGSDYEQLTDTNAPQNPLLRKYNLADRDRRSIGFHANLIPVPDYTVGVSLDSYRDSYDKSVIGLTESRSNSLNIDVSTMLSESTSIFVFLGAEKIESEQAGSSAFADPDWFATNEDSFENLGVGVTHLLMENRLEIGADYTVTNSTGKITVDTVSAGEPFPDLTTRLDSIRVYANYRLDESLSLRFAYWHETYDVSDWAIDDLEADTLGNLLAFGEDDGSYSNDVVTMSLAFTIE